SSISLAEMRLVETRPFQLGSAHFLITALWQAGSTVTNLGFLSSLFAASGIDPAFRAGGTGSSKRRLVVTVRTGRHGIGWARTAHTSRVDHAEPESHPARDGADRSTTIRNRCGACGGRAVHRIVDIPDDRGDRHNGTGARCRSRPADSRSVACLQLCAE